MGLGVREKCIQIWKGALTAAPEQQAPFYIMPGCHPSLLSPQRRPWVLASDAQGCFLVQPGPFCVAHTNLLSPEREQSWAKVWDSYTYAKLIALNQA